MRNATELQADWLNYDKTRFVLTRYKRMLHVLKDYEFSKKHAVNGMTLYDLANAEGLAKRGEHGQETISDVTANSVVLKDKSTSIADLYEQLAIIVQAAINNLPNIQQRRICEMLFLENRKYKDVVSYMRKGYSKDLPPISSTSVAGLRRQAIKEIAQFLNIYGVLDYVVEDRQKYKSSFRLAIPGIEE